MVHKIMVPIDIKKGKIDSIKSGSFTVDETIAVIDGKDVCMVQYWPVRVPRPVAEKYQPDVPLITGLRVLDTMFPSRREERRPSPVRSVPERPSPSSPSPSTPMQRSSSTSDAESVETR